jgi:glycosyltransferase involved in cell wall biosynthesis
MANHLNTGGITSYLLTLSRGLVSQGHQVYVMSAGGNLVERLEAGGVRHVDIGFRTKSEADPRIYFALGRIAKFIRDERIDIIHSHTRITQLMGELLSRQTGVPYVSTCHGFYKLRFFRRMFPCWGCKIIAISRAVYDHLIKDFKMDQKNIALIPNGIDMAEFTILPSDARKDLRERYKISDGPLIGIIARLADVKGHVYLIEAMKDVIIAFPSAKLFIVGEGREEKRLRALVNSLGLSENIQFFKVVNRSAEMLPIFDVFVLPSTDEGLGLSAMEAQASGLPVVASRVGGLPDVIEHNRSGVLVEPRNPKALAEAIVGILQNPAKAWDMGRMARVFIEKHFNSSRMVLETLEVYQSVKRE